MFASLLSGHALRRKPDSKFCTGAYPRVLGVQVEEATTLLGLVTHDQASWITDATTSTDPTTDRFG